MSEEKPLHVQVAEALGWTDFKFDPWWVDGCKHDKPFWHGHDPVRTETAPTTALNGVQGFKYVSEGVLSTNYHPEALHWPVPRYDRDWSAAGPLIEKYKLALWYVNGFGTPEWRTNSEDNGLQLDGAETGPTPLIAVCHLILALKAAGKL